MRTIIPFKQSLFSVFILMLLASTVRAQRYIGIATSDWTAINSLYLNPACIADCREKMSIGICSFNASVDNNLGFIPKIPDIGTAISNNDNIFTRTPKKSFSMMAPAAVFRGPGAMFTLSEKISIAFTSGIRAINQFNNFDPALYKIFSATSSLPSAGYKANARDFNWTAHLWSEIGFTFAAVVYQGYRDRLNFGITVRRLGGIGYVSVTGKNIDLNYQPDSGRFSATNSDIRFSSNVATDSAAAFKNITPAGLLQKFFGGTAGGGMSTDLGFTYRYRIGDIQPSDYMESNTTHDIILSAAVTDLGFIRYYNSTNAVINITGSGNLSTQELKDHGTNVASIVNYAKTNGFNVDTTTEARKVYLPVTLLMSADVQVQGRFFVNLLYIANMANRNNFGNSYYNQLTITPRYDFHKMTLALPITYSMLASDLKLGFAVRYSGFFIGSDDVMALVNKSQYGFGVYFGGYIPIFKKHVDPVGLHWGT